MITESKRGNNMSDKEEYTARAMELPPKIEPGEYEAICTKVDYRPNLAYGRELKIFVRFVIQGPKYEGTELFMAMPRKKSPIHHTSKQCKQWMLAIGRVPEKNDRFSKKVFLNKLFLIIVRDTKRELIKGRSYGSQFQYSVVETIIEPLTGVQIKNA